MQNIITDNQNYYEPFKLTLNYLYHALDLRAMKKAYYYMKKGILKDNKGWITETNDQSELIGLDRTKCDFYN